VLPLDPTIHPTPNPFQVGPVNPIVVPLPHLLGGVEHELPEVEEMRATAETVRATSGDTQLQALERLMEQLHGQQ
jgi:hypothetical protein